MEKFNNERNHLYKYLRSKKGELIRIKHKYQDYGIAVDMGVLLFVRYNPPHAGYHALLNETLSHRVAILVYHDSREKWFFVEKSNVEFL